MSKLWRDDQGGAGAGVIELIAECATNAGNSVPLAKEFIDRFAEAGADWIKFQYTRVQHLRPDDPQFDWFKQAELSDEQFAELKAHTEAAGAKFLLTVYNHQDVPAVKALGLDTIKIGSGEAGDGALADAVCSGVEFRRILVGTGLCAYDRSPFYRTVGPWIKNQHGEGWSVPIDGRVRFLQCVTRYPHPAIAALRDYKAPCVGYSDHSIGLDGCMTAILQGAQIIEKHVQLPHQARPCRSFEATVEEFKALRQFADEDPTRFLGRWQHA